MARCVFSLSVASALLIAGCGSSPETVGQVRDRYRAPISQLRAQLKTVHLGLRTQTSGLTAKLNPKPVYVEGGPGNTDFLALEHLSDTDARPPINLALAQAVQASLSWTGPANVDDPNARREATTDVEATFKQALATRYLVVLRSSRGPVTAARNVYAGGDATLEAFVVDLTTNAVVASVTARGAAAGPVQVDAPAGLARTERANALLTAAAVVELRRDLAEKLAAATGGTFSFTKPRSSVLAASS